MKDAGRPASSSAPRRSFVDPERVHVHPRQGAAEPDEYLLTLRFGSGGKLCAWPATDDPDGLARALATLGRALIEFPRLAGQLAGVEDPR